MQAQRRRKDPPTVPGFFHPCADPYPPVVPDWRRYPRPRRWGWWSFWKFPRGGFAPRSTPAPTVPLA